MSLFGTVAELITGRMSQVPRTTQLVTAAPPPVPETPEYVDARTEARTLCRNLGLDVENEHWDGAGIGDFIRLAYAQGWKACESRLTSPDVADAIAVAIEHPGQVLLRIGPPHNDLPWKVAAVQRAAVHGVPQQ